MNISSLLTKELGKRGALIGATLVSFVILASAAIDVAYAPSWPDAFAGLAMMAFFLALNWRARRRLRRHT